MSRDETEEHDKFGQNVRKAFPLADVFVDASIATRQLERVFKLYLGHPFITPQMDPGMGADNGLKPAKRYP